MTNSKLDDRYEPSRMFKLDYEKSVDSLEDMRQLSMTAYSRVAADSLRPDTNLNRATCQYMKDRCEIVEAKLHLVISEELQELRQRMIDYVCTHWILLNPNDQDPHFQ